MSNAKILSTPEETANNAARILRQNEEKRARREARLQRKAARLAKERAQLGHSSERLYY